MAVKTDSLTPLGNCSDLRKGKVGKSSSKKPTVLSPLMAKENIKVRSRLIQFSLISHENVNIV